MWRRRILEVTGDLTAGDGLATVLRPQDHMRLWQTALPWRWWRDFVQWFIARPALTRLLGLLQLVIGAWLIVRASDDQQ